ncbi:lysylphosphatidylglycerol synthase transmembrane domain-containing protein [Actinomadura sp. DC4]|uniref:lysylphosphatidylglycerol synthase transmembrane domain-containing protein n=1 Tax=Actinomadura sp. DC4 TaxID=3055069 RepID=UPI0025B24234|nr:lysylphosphatidylglycerol synthase transmembrane domain-containing protein [Actinomadura sp. DC4]MDN3355509.1 lysylphosphatidylglycerol synthase transmembrane domain-containing protein [Actinomadura sp. DC4]
MISRLRSSRLPRVALVVVALAFCVYGLASRWGETRHAVTAFSWPYIGAALLFGVLGLGAWMQAWRSLLAGMGSPLPLRAAVRIYFVSQLGKYIPGSVWALVAQMELAKEHRVPRERGASAALLAMATTIATGCAVAAVTLPLTSADATHRYWWLLILAPIFLASLHPRVVAFALDRALRLARRQPLARTAGLGTMVVTVAWTAAGWLLFGVHAWLLVRAAGGSGFFLATGAYALAFTAGFLVVIAPGGVGVREAALTVALGPVLASGAPLVVALASRVVMTVADLAWAGAAVLLGSRHPAVDEAELLEEQTDAR